MDVDSIPFAEETRAGKPTMEHEMTDHYDIVRETGLDGKMSFEGTPLTMAWLTGQSQHKTRSYGKAIQNPS